MHLSLPARFLILVLAAWTLAALLACTREAEPETVVKEVPVEVIKEVPVEKVVEKEVPVEKVVEKIVEVTAVAEPTTPPTTMAGPPIYQMGIFEEPISRNFWNYYGGPAGSVWTGYVLDGHSGALYGYSDQRFDWGAGPGGRLPHRPGEGDGGRRRVLDSRGAAQGRCALERRP